MHWVDIQMHIDKGVKNVFTLKLLFPTIVMSIDIVNTHQSEKCSATWNFVAFKEKLSKGGV